MGSAQPSIGESSARQGHVTNSGAGRPERRGKAFRFRVLAEAVAPEHPARVARDLERCLCAEPLGGDRVLQ
jgi:hypothetical protein